MIPGPRPIYSWASLARALPQPLSAPVPDQELSPSAASVRPTPSDLDSLVLALESEFRTDPSGAGAAQLLEQYAAQASDWRANMAFDPDHYTRNLIQRTGNFELLLLGWGAGQESPIHNHEGQNCWMAVLEGPIEELHFRLSPDGVGVPPLAGPVRSFEAGQVAFIRDEIALHLVRATPSAPGVSLHLYAKPYDACNCYCDATGQVTRKQLQYDTIRGRQIP